MTGILEHIDYESENFYGRKIVLQHRINYRVDHYQHELVINSDGQVDLTLDSNGVPKQYPRSLKDLCAYAYILDSSNMFLLDNSRLPFTMYNHLFTEAILTQQLYGVSYLISVWPMPVLTVLDLIPIEDKLSMNADYLTKPFEGHYHLSILDCIIIGLLNLTEKSVLKAISFQGFENDKRLCKELCRLPLLWMKPAERIPNVIHQLIRSVVDVSLEKIIRYLHRILTVYRNLDTECMHGHNISPVTIDLCLNCSLDDVPIGLALQQHTPFRFHFYQMQYEFLPDCQLPLSNLHLVTESENIYRLDLSYTHWTAKEQEELQSGLRCLKNLSALGVHIMQPADADGADGPQAALINRLCGALPDLFRLRRLSLCSCHLGGCLAPLLTALQPCCIEYLNLTDCRLTARDIDALSSWSGLSGLRELNLSMNNLSTQLNCCLSMLELTPQLVLLSLSYCSLPSRSLAQLTRHCAQQRLRLRVLCLQSYTPPERNGILDMLLASTQLPTLQKFLLLPTGLYAFPGRNNVDRANSRNSILAFCRGVLAGQARSDLVYYE